MSPGRHGCPHCDEDPCFTGLPTSSDYHAMRHDLDRLRTALSRLVNLGPWKYDYERGVDRCRYCDTPVRDLGADFVRHSDACAWAQARAALKWSTRL